MPAQPIYIEAEEEIPEVIERIRLSTSSEVPLVIPARSRLGQSRFNFQLLRQYASQLDKKVAIISPDPTVQAMAEEHGFAAFHTADRYDRRPEEEEELVPVRASSVAAVSAAARSQALPPSTLPRVRMAAPQRLDSRGGEGRPGRLVLYLGALLMLLVGVAAMAIYVPSATVTMVADAAVFEAPDVSVAAEPNKPPVRVRSVAVSKTASQGFNATGTKTVPGDVARGTFSYTNSCPFGLQIPNGQRLRGAGQEFAQQGDVTVGRGQASSVNIVATQPGNGGNVGVGAITAISGNPFDCLTGSNPAATAGGKDEQKLKEITSADMETARSALEQQLRKQIGDDLTKQAQPGEKLSDQLVTQPPDLATDHKVGENLPTFTATMTLKAEGALYMVDDVQKAFTEALRQKVPADQTLTDNKSHSDWQVTSSAGGRLVFRGRASGFVAPKLDLERIKGRMVARPAGSVRKDLSRYPVRSVEVKEHPVRLPLMPLVGSRIDLQYVVQQGTAAPRRG